MNPFLFAASDAVAEPAVAPVPGKGPATAGTISISDGESNGSLPSGENEPAVTLACAPSGSIPADTMRHPPGCPDAQWCRGNRACYWNCEADPDEGLTDCIGEIFIGAAKIDDRRFILDEHALMDELEEPPFFLRDYGWRRARA